MECTTDDCGRQTSLYLCTSCIVELDELLMQVPALVVALDPGILACKVTKAAGSGSETRNANKAGSQAPMNIDVDLLRDWLKTLLGLRAYDLATNSPLAGQYIFMARMWVDSANVVTHGAQELTPRDTTELQQRFKEEIPAALTTPKLIQWLKTVCGITIHPATIWKWAEREHITRTNQEGHPTYSPAAVLIQIREHGRN